MSIINRSSMIIPIPNIQEISRVVRPFDDIFMANNVHILNRYYLHAYKHISMPHVYSYNCNLYSHETVFKTHDYVAYTSQTNSGRTVTL